jgi:hypothetical protein
MTMMSGNKAPKIVCAQASDGQADEERFEAEVTAHQHIFEPLENWLTGHFSQQHEERYNGPEERYCRYRRRPNIGLRLLTPDRTQVLVVRPRWRPPRVLRHKVEQFGMLNLIALDLELMRDTKLEQHIILRYLEPAKPEVTATDPDQRRADLATIVGICHDFLMDPEGVLARSPDNCCNCGRRLTSNVSRTRGVCSKCSHYLYDCPGLTGSLTCVEDYRDAYLRETGSLPGR